MQEMLSLHDSVHWKLSKAGGIKPALSPFRLFPVDFCPFLRYYAISKKVLQTDERMDGRTSGHVLE